MPRIVLALLVLAAVGGSSVLAGCGSDDSERRVIAITQLDQGCTPESIDLATGEKVTFEITNNGKRDREIEGIDGTRLQEVLVPSGKTRKVNFTAPGDPVTQKLKCYVPGGDSVLIELKIAGPAN